MIRLPKWLVVVLALAVLVGLAAPSFAADSVGRGTVKNIAADKSQFVLTDANNKDFMISWAENTRVVRDGKDVKVTDLKVNDSVSLVYDKGVTKNTASFIYVHKEGSKEELGRGKIKDVTPKGEVVLTDLNNKDWTFGTDGGKIQLAGKEGKVSDLKKDDMITVIYEKDGEKLMLKEVYTSPAK